MIRVSHAMHRAPDASRSWKNDDSRLNVNTPELKTGHEQSRSLAISADVALRPGYGVVPPDSMTA